MKFRIVLLSFVTLLAFNRCATLQQMQTFAKCEFKCESLVNTKLAGVNVDGLKGKSDLKFTDMAKISGSLLKGKLPLTFTLNVAAKNPNGSKAAMSKMEWIALIDNKEILNGVLDKKVEIEPNGGVVSIPLNLSLDLLEIFGKDEGQKIMNYGFGLTEDGSNTPSRVSLKIKPTLNVAGINVPYPGYITVKKDFTSN